MSIGKLDHAYRFPDTEPEDLRYVQDDLDITAHEDYTGVARERIMTPERRERYADGTWEMRPATSFPEEETTWTAARKVLEHDLATTDPDDPADAYFLVKNAEMTFPDARSEAVAELAVLPDDRIAMPETLVLPYGDREAEMSRFVPNLVWHNEPTELTADTDWHARADRALHDFLTFNYWIDNDEEGAANYAFTPDGNIVLFDQHPAIVGGGPDDLVFGGRYTPDATLYRWDHDTFRESAAAIGAVTDREMADALADVDPGPFTTADGSTFPTYDLDGLRERRDILRTVGRESDE